MGHRFQAPSWFNPGTLSSWWGQNGNFALLRFMLVALFMKMALFALAFVSLGFSSSLLANTLVVVSGGYRSCAHSDAPDPLPRIPKIQDIAPKAHKVFGDNVTYLYSCYSGMHPDLRTIELQFSQDVSFKLRNQVYLRFDNFNSTRVLHDLFDFVAYHADRLDDPTIYLVGHSYGGWTAIQLAAHLFSRNKKVRGLELIDPINPIICAAPEMAKQLVLTTALLRTTSLTGCQRAPLIPTAVLNGLFSEGYWHNTYQTSFPFLHSGPIYASVDLGDRGRNQHYRFMELKRIWPKDFHNWLSINGGVWHGISERYRYRRR